MAYSQALVIAGGLAHIPVVTGIFWLFDKSNNPKQLTTKKVKKSPNKPKIASITEKSSSPKTLPEIKTSEKTTDPEIIIQENKTIENTMTNGEMNVQEEQQ